VIVYEVSLALERALAHEYLDWLREHVQQMLALPGFEQAEVFAIDATDAAAPQVELAVQYRLRDEAALTDYFTHHAADMRARGFARFGDRVHARRRVLRPVAPG
jgi:hypothetical protein